MNEHPSASDIAFVRFVHMMAFGPGAWGLMLAWRIESWELAAWSIYAAFVWSWRELVAQHWREFAPAALRARVATIGRLTLFCVDAWIEEWRLSLERKPWNDYRSQACASHSSSSPSSSPASS